MPQPYILIPPQGTEQADEWVKIGMASHQVGNLPEAQRHYQAALRIDPQHAIATNNLALVFAQSNLINEALLTIERASMLDGVFGVIQANWGFMALEAERVDVALEASERAVAITPCMETKMCRAMVLSTAGMPEGAVEVYRDILKDHPGHTAAGPNICFAATLTDMPPEESIELRKAWYAVHGYKGPKKPHHTTKHERIRVGYVCGDFKCHSAAMIYKDIISKHSQEFEAFYYCTLAVDPVADAYTKEFQALGNWRDIVALSDEQADELIRQDEIDILVDLAGHTNGGRLALFSRKPAPVQVTAWGFAHGTGVPEIDYFFADPIAVKEEERPFYAEKIYDLPCIVTYTVPTNYHFSGVSSLPYKRNDYTTFGVHARYEKLSDKFLATVGKILKAIPNSKIEFKDAGFRRPYSIKRIQRLLGVDSKRLMFSIATGHDEHLQSYQRADIILDPFPHTGGLVGMEQLFMGVPVVTRYGTQAAGRTTSSVLTAMGRTEWIARNEQEYVKIVINLAKDTKKLAEVRKTLREEFVQSPVVTGYREAVEKAYKTMLGRT